MTEQTTLDFTPKKKMSRQCQKLYNRLLLGPVRNTELRDDTDLLEYRRRFKDLRDFHGISTKRTPLGHGVNEYSLG
jgi:hypothetical protein